MISHEGKQMTCDYGFEREFAIFDESGRMNATEASQKAMTLLAGNEWVPERLQLKPGGFGAYMDCGHLEMYTPACNSVISGVIALKKMDAIVAAICKKTGLSAYKGNWSARGSTTFANHDNYVFYGSHAAEHARISMDHQNSHMNAFMVTRYVVCGEGGMIDRHSFSISPRFRHFIMYRFPEIVQKGRRIEVSAGVDNSSPVSAALRIGTFPIAVALCRRLRMPAPSSLWKRNALLDAYQFSPSTPINGVILEAAEYQYSVAKRAEEDAYEPGMPADTHRIAGMWKKAAAAIMNGDLPPYVDWCAKLKIVSGMKYAGSAIALDANWHRLDRDDGYYRTISANVPEIADFDYSVDHSVRDGERSLESYWRMAGDHNALVFFCPTKMRFISEHSSVDHEEVRGRVPETGGVPGRFKGAGCMVFSNDDSDVPPMIGKVVAENVVRCVATMKRYDVSGNACLPFRRSTSERFDIVRNAIKSVDEEIKGCGP